METLVISLRSANTYTPWFSFVVDVNCFVFLVRVNNLYYGLVAGTQTGGKKVIRRFFGEQ